MVPNDSIINPDYLFEVSWEVCNKVGGIYTVISTKAPSLEKMLNNNYILIGPDIWMETRNNPEFIEDKSLYKPWCVQAEKDQLRFRIGRWNIVGSPVVILVDFAPLFNKKDEIFGHLWEKFGLDSIAGQWDYTEPALFGYAAAQVIKSFYDFYISAHDKVIAQFHEWMTGSGVLHLKEQAPQIATVFTTHATVLGRCIAGNQLPLYSEMPNYDAEQKARDFGVYSKFSLEKISARESDCFTTVSSITAEECRCFLGKDVDVVTPNGFDNAFVPQGKSFNEARNKARGKFKETVEALTQQKVEDNALYLLNSGRYEFLNKGIDLYIDALGQLNRNAALHQQIIAFIAVPAHNYGPSNELLQALQHIDFNHPTPENYCTHYLDNPEADAMIRRIKANELFNRPEDKVKVVVVPTYLDGNEGIFNLPYYDFLIGFDLTIFPSYYEPWGYTPLESIAFSIPTITTTLAGFGAWVNETEPGADLYAKVIERNDRNSSEVVAQIEASVIRFLALNETQHNENRENAKLLSGKALWGSMIDNYFQAYHLALGKSASRYDLYHGKTQLVFMDIQNEHQLNNNWHKVLIKPSIPKALEKLSLLAKNLWWSWNEDAIQLFQSIHPEYWIKSNKNPFTLFEWLTYDDFKALEKNQEFKQKLEEVYQQFMDYMRGGPEKPATSVAYFSMEFGLHQSLKIYSGGLGILAGDYLKEASDCNANIFGIGLLYRKGYFDQSISLLGDQIAGYNSQRFSQMPLIPVRHCGKSIDDPESWVKVRIAIRGGNITAKVWRVDIGRTCLYLLDTDIDENSAEDRTITHNLYEKGEDMRFKQELLLGVGGIRCLEQMNIKPDIYHCNEGHAAFIGLERLRKLVNDENLTFNEALEVVRASNLFTSHTPVPAGHDTFPEDMLRTYIPHYADRLKISWETFMNLGRYVENNVNERFSMTVLASRLSGQINGVSRIHGKVTCQLLAGLFPGFYPEELNNIGYVTNGVHFPTWVSPEWRQLYDKFFDKKYILDQSNEKYWKKIHEIPDKKIWELREQHRRKLTDFLKDRLVKEMTLRQNNPQHIFKISESLNPKALTIGFARRFASYKRAHLLFTDLERLAQIVNNPKCPIQFVFAGKAHPNDGVGQDLIKKIYQITNMPEFVGKVMLIENYDIEVGKMLTQGVDIWLNTPTRPQEASGTSGEKAIMNGVINFSVLDGWWAEGYREDGGWALQEERTYQHQPAQDALDAVCIYNLLEDEIIPMFYDRNADGVPVAWTQKVKNTIAHIAPNFTMKRMLDDYRRKFYHEMFQRTHELTKNQYLNTKKLVSWKQKLYRSWDNIETVSINTSAMSDKPMALGEKFFAEVKIKINELNQKDIGVELLFGQKVTEHSEKILFRHEMELVKKEKDVLTFYFEKNAESVGVYDYAFRVFPKNDLLGNRQDFNLLKWL